MQTTFQLCYLAWILLRLLSLEAKVFMSFWYLVPQELHQNNNEFD